MFPDFDKVFQSVLNDSEPESAALRRLADAGITDVDGAVASLRRIAGDGELREMAGRFLPDLINAMANAADPDRALIALERFLERVPDKRLLIEQMARERRVTEKLATLFAGSEFLTEILLRYPAYFRYILENQHLLHPGSREQLLSEAHQLLRENTDSDQRLSALHGLQRRELLQIGAADLYALADLKTVTVRLSRLADVVVQTCLRIVGDEAGGAAEGFCVLALGKLGGQELNYSSDIDLLFVSREGNEDDNRLGQQLIEALSSATEDGFFYRVDMRLRPWGSIGKLVPSMDEHLTYLRDHARGWEKQAMLKVRAIAGDLPLGQQLVQTARQSAYNMINEVPDFAAVLRDEIVAMKVDIERRLRRRGQKWGELKSGNGSIRDVEFLTQYLQLIYGHDHPDIRSRNTLNALARLNTAGLLPADAYQALAGGYTFLRSAEHYLQVMHNRQVHRLPDDRKEIASLARRLGFQTTAGDAGEQFRQRYEDHRRAVREAYERYLVEAGAETPGEVHDQAIAASKAQKQHLQRMDPSYRLVFSETEIAGHVEMLGRLSPENLVEIDAAPLDEGMWRITIVGYDYPGELSIICGLLFALRFDIIDGHIYTYEPVAAASIKKSARPASLKRRYVTPDGGNGIRKIVDVFTIRTMDGRSLKADDWAACAAELRLLLGLLRQRELQAAQGRLAGQVAAALRHHPPDTTPLLPVEIDLDNSDTGHYSILRIDAPDTPGFLYEFTNALTLNGVYIARMTVGAVDNRVHDTLYVTDLSGGKITDYRKQQQLRAAAALVKHFTHLLPRAPNPVHAMQHFRDYTAQLFHRPDWHEAFATLQQPEVLDALARLLGVSDFLWEDFLRMQHANLFPVLRDIAGLKKTKSAGSLRSELNETLTLETTFAEQMAALNRFKDREMFRIDMRYIQGLIPQFWMFAAELSDLAEVVIATAYHHVYDNLVAAYGEPLLESGEICASCILALGKFGGREIGFASDIELMFVYQGSGDTDGARPISNGEFFERLVHDVSQAIQARHEGIFEIDLRLRPYGKAGSIAVPLGSFRRYFAPEGPAWAYERQALVRLRPIAGDEKLGRTLSALRNAAIYSGTSFSWQAMRAMRERQLRQLVAGGQINAKFSPGGLVDLEYLVQGLQMTYGGDNPNLRKTNTADALHALGRAGVVIPEHFRLLHEAYLFLRRLIEGLRMARGNARDLTVPPADSDAFAFLARRLSYEDAPPDLYDAIIEHMAQVERICKLQE